MTYPIHRDPAKPKWGEIPNASEQDAEVSVARSLRLAMVQNQLDQGNLTEEDALELLRGCLTPNDESTRYDDSKELKTNRNAEKIIWHYGDPPEAGYYLVTWEDDRGLFPKLKVSELWYHGVGLWVTSRGYLDQPTDEPLKERLLDKRVIAWTHKPNPAVVRSQSEKENK